MIRRYLPRFVLVALALSLAGCASYHQPRYGHDGVYYDPPQVQYRAVHVDPLLYPYWSLDYFYFSRYYHPYSVLVDFYDPWYYPYPGWYYGYRAGPRVHVSIGHGSSWYPWYGYGARYHYYQPWGFRYVHYPRYRHTGYAHQPRVRQIDERMRDLERRQRAETVANRPPRAPAIHSDEISSRRAASRPGQSAQERRQASSVRRSIQQDQSTGIRIPRTREPAPRVFIPRAQTETAGPRTGSTRESAARDRATIRAGSPREAQQPAARQRGSAPTRSNPQPAPPRSSPPTTRQPASQPAPSPRQSAPPPRQRSAPARQRQREQEP